MAVTAALIKELREVSGAGMTDCKNALTESDGNIERAIEILREKGLAAAAKKAGRLASEGLVLAHITDDNKIGVLVEVNSETDFVAKNDLFKEFTLQVANQAVQSSANDMDAFMAETWNADTSITVKDALNQKIAVIGENLNIRRFDKIETVENGCLISYIHAGGKVAVLIEMQIDGAISNAAELTEAGKNICMQIAAMSPKFVARGDVSQDFIEKEKEILTLQANKEQEELAPEKRKPANVLEKIVMGRLDKELKEFCLLEQEYVKDSELTVSKYIDAVSKEVGCGLKLTRFLRYETGEGLEKKSENFAEEVNKAMGN